MGKINYIVVRGKSKYSNEIEKIYHQNDHSKGGFFFDNCIISDINDMAKENHKNIFMILALEHGKVVGFAQLIDCYLPSSLYIAVLAVDEENQNRGIGSGLVDYVLHHSLGYNSVSLETFSRNERAVRLYKSMGFDFVLKYNVLMPGKWCEEQNFFQASTNKIFNNSKIEYSDLKKMNDKWDEIVKTRQSQVVDLSDYDQELLEM